METLDRNIAVYHNALVNSRYKLTTVEQRFVLSVIAQIKQEDKDFHLYEFKANTLFDKKVLAENHHTRLKNFAKSLMSKPLEVLIEGGFEVYNWFSMIRYKDGILSVSIDPRLKPYLLQLNKHFTKYQLQYVLPMESTYSVRIYQMLKQFRAVGEREFVVEKLKNILEIPKVYGYGQFKQKILDLAVREIRQFTDIEVSYNPSKKIKKRVINIKFTIKTNNFKSEFFQSFVNSKISIKGEIFYIDKIYCDNGYLCIDYKDKTIQFMDTDDFFRAIEVAENQPSLFDNLDLEDF